MIGGDLGLKLKGLMAVVFEIAPDRLGEDAAQGNPPEWDSFHHLNLIMAIEEEFGVRFGDDEVVKMSSYRDIIEALGRKLD